MSSRSDLTPPLHQDSPDSALVIPDVRRPSGSRRQVTVLFCDLVGATRLSTLLDPEELEEVLHEYRRAVAGAIERFGGRLHPTLGDGLMASWGYPRAAEDDADRAVLAGLAGLAAVQTTSVPGRERLQARVGIHTGIAVISDTVLGGRREIGNLVGETPNLAARLQTVAETNTVVISEQTLELVRGRCQVRELGARELRGIPRPVQVFTVVGSDPDEGVGSADPHPARTQQSDPALLRSLVGRDREEAALAAAWSEAEAGGSRIMAIGGEAGMGKTALAVRVSELAENRGGTTAVIRCASVQQGSAFYPLRRLVERSADIGVGDPLELRRLRLIEYSRRHSALSSTEAVAGLAAVLGLPSDPGVPELELPRERRRERTLELLLDFLDGFSSHTPLLLVVEDAHWADPSTEELLHRLVRRGAAPSTLVLIATREPDQLAIPECDQLRLGPLDDEDVLELTRQFAPHLPDELCRAVVARADGVPLFGSEIARLLSTSGTTTDSAIPPRLHDLLVARLDQRPQERDVAQLVSVLGTSAPLSHIRGVATATLGELGPQLDRLVTAGILRSDGPAQDPVFRFAHVLLRDAAYETLLRSRRRTLHAAVADVLQRDMPTGTVPPNVLAHHLEAAGEIAASVRFWWQAALGAAAMAAHREVVAHLRHTLDLLQEIDEPVDVDEIAVLSTLVVSLEVLEGYTSPNVAAVHQRALGLLTREEERHPSRHRHPGLLWPVWAYHHVRGERESSTSLSRDLWAQNRHRPGPQRATAAVMLGHDCLEGGVLADAETLFEVARSEAGGPPTENPHDLPAAAGVLLGITRWLRGNRSSGCATVRAAVSRAEQLGPRTGAFNRAFVNSYAAWWALLADDVDAAVRHATRSVEAAGADGYATWLAASTMHAAGAQARSGEAEMAAATLEPLLAAWRAAGAEAFRPVFLRWLAEAYAALGRTSSALTALDEAITHTARHGGAIHQPELHRVRAQILLQDGRRDESLAALRTAADIAVQQDALSPLMNALSDLVAIQPEGSSPAARRELAEVLNRVVADESDLAVARARRLSGTG